MLKQVYYFANLPYSTRETIHYKFISENYEKGAKIFEQGQECKSMYFIVSGKIELVIEKENKDHVLDILPPGTVIGAYSLINENPFKFTAKAHSNLHLLLLSWDDIIDIADNDTDLHNAIEDATEYIFNNEVPICDYNAI